MDSILSDEERRTLLRLARAAIGQRLCGDRRLDSALEGSKITAALERRHGLFVTLKESAPAGSDSTGPVLRGCIGIMESSEPLYRTVIDTAPKAAFEDPRFPPLAIDELDSMWIGVSVLTPMSPVKDWREIVVGRDGVQLRREPHRSVFLPQVATEQAWDRERLLSQLALKAGLGSDGWRSADLFTFQAESFAEPAPARHSPGGG
jgi:hypothetical protein